VIIADPFANNVPFKVINGNVKIIKHANDTIPPSGITNLKTINYARNYINGIGLILLMQISPALWFISMESSRQMFQKESNTTMQPA